MKVKIEDPNEKKHHAQGIKDKLDEFTPLLWIINSNRTTGYCHVDTIRDWYTSSDEQNETYSPT